MADAAVDKEEAVTKQIEVRRTPHAARHAPRASTAGGPSGRAHVLAG